MSDLYSELYGYLQAYTIILVDEIPTTEPPVTTTDQSSHPLTTQPPFSISVDPITTSGTSIAGEIYSLVCSVSVTGSTEQPTITWLNPMNRQITSEVETTGSMNTLTFNPLATSDAGTYTCRATLGSAMDSASRTITVRSKSHTDIILKLIV